MEYKNKTESLIVIFVTIAQTVVCALTLGLYIQVLINGGVSTKIVAVICGIWMLCVGVSSAASFPKALKSYKKYKSQTKLSKTVTLTIEDIQKMSPEEINELFKTCTTKDGENDERDKRI